MLARVVNTWEHDPPWILLLTFLIVTGSLPQRGPALVGLPAAPGPGVLDQAVSGREERGPAAQHPALLQDGEVRGTAGQKTLQVRQFVMHYGKPVS